MCLKESGQITYGHEKTCAGKLLKGENGSLAQKNEADQILAKAPCDHDNRKQTGKRQQRSPTAL